MKLIVGLGNPGRKYQGTRHNVGFDVLDLVAQRHATMGKKTKFEGEITEADFAGERALLLWPQTFMNLSGSSVGKAFDFYKFEFGDLLVLCDDFNLPLSVLRFRAKGSAGGQKGLADIIHRLGTEDFSRLRIGVGPVPDRWDPADFVLGKFSRQEGPVIEEAVFRAANAVATWVSQGTNVCMNQFN